MPLTVLLVDDEADLAEPMAYALRRAGLEVSVVSSGSAALASVAARPPDVLILDRRLPDIDGVDVVATLRGNSFGGAVIVASGCSGEEHAATCLAAGADSVLLKPFTLAELVTRVHDTVAARSLPLRV